MSQISPPIRILLAGSILFLMAWFTVLRPGQEEVPPPAPASAPAPAAEAPATAAGSPQTPTSAYGKAVRGAREASVATSAASAAHAGEAAVAAPQAAASEPAAAKGAAAGAAKSGAKARSAALGLPVSVAKALARRKVLVMLFWNRNAIDDQAVRRELRGIDRHKGKVKVHVASIKDVARYAPITRGVNLDQSPTVVVVKGSTADALVGYVDRRTIEQAVSDLLRQR